MSPYIAALLVKIGLIKIVENNNEFKQAQNK